MKDYAALSSIPLKAGTSYCHPKDLPELVHEDSPAVDVMTDFNQVPPITIKSNVSIVAALNKMRSSGVHFLLVTNEDKTIIGVVTSTDLMGEKPIKLIEDSGMTHHSISVSMIMAAQEDVTVLNMISMHNAEVGHIIQTLKELERKHTLIVEVDESTGQQKVRGLFSYSQITHQLGRDPNEEVPAAHSLAEIQHEIG